MLSRLKYMVVALAAAFSFSLFADTFTWTSAVNGNFETPGNWTLASTGAPSTVAPGANDDIVIPDLAAAYTVTVNSAFSIHSLTVGGAGGSATVTLNFKHGNANAVAGNVQILSNAIVAQAQGGSYRVSLDVGGNVTVDTGAKINVTGYGYTARNGPGYNGGKSNNQKTASASHGGRFANYSAATYGSLVAPTQCGSGSYNGAGGGAIRIAATGALVVNGEILANGAEVSGYASGSGGSVWLTGTSLSGSGTISANGGRAGNGGSGAGGRVSVCLSQSSGFSGWQGVTSAYGGTGGTFERSHVPAGTVYLQSGNGVANSTTIVDNNGLSMKETGYVELKSAADSASLGTLIVRNNGGVNIADNEEVEVYGSINTTGGTASWSGGTVRLKGATSATIEGKSTYGNFVCEVPGKSLVFGTTANDCLTIADGGTLVLHGDGTAKLNLAPDDLTKTWALKLGATATPNVEYVSVTNSNASAGASVTATLSDDLGGNANWIFTSPIVPGETIVWTGAASDDWLAAGNWDRARPITDTDTIVIPATAQGEPIANMPRLATGSHTLNRMTIEAGALLTLAGGCSVTITNGLSVAGTLRATGSEKIVCTKDVSFAGGAFEAGSSIFCLEGAGAQSVNPNGQSFASLFVEKQSGAVSFADGFAASRFDVHSAGALTVAFAAGSTVDATNCYFRGRLAGGGQALTLQSTTAGTAWKLKNVGDQFVAGVVVSDSDAREGAEILPDASVDATGNLGWNFNSGIGSAIWIGGTGVFGTASNWDSGAVPGANSRVLISGEAGESQTVTVNAPFSVQSLVVGSGLTSATVNLVFAHNNANAVAGDVHIMSGATLAHTQGGSYRVSLDVGGNVTVDAGAKINVTACGYGRLSGPGYNGGTGNNQKTASASHGGRLAANSAATYGSLVAPTYCGSGSYNSGGGGAVRISASGALVVNGDILANGANIEGYASGSGGSVWLTGTSISGSGTISANGGSASSGGSGAGGRVAVCLSDESGFEGWTGSISARAGTGLNSERGIGSAGTVYLQRGAKVENSTTIIDNAGMSMRENGYVEFKKGTDSVKFGAIIVRNRGRVKLLADARAQDLDLATADVNFNTGTNVLTVREYTHKDGKGWAGTFANLVTRETDSETGKVGDIVWKNPGLTIIFR